MSRMSLLEFKKENERRSPVKYVFDSRLNKAESFLSDASYVLEFNAINIMFHPNTVVLKSDNSSMIIGRVRYIESKVVNGCNEIVFACGGSMEVAESMYKVKAFC